MADYSKDLYDYKYECRRNCSSYDDGYNQALEDLIEKIGNYRIVCNDGVTEIVEIKEIIRCKEQLKR